jgi:hypothetical protein
MHNINFEPQQNVVQIDTLSLEQFPNDPAVMNSNVSSELFAHFASLEPRAMPTFQITIKWLYISYKTTR